MQIFLMKASLTIVKCTTQIEIELIAMKLHRSNGQPIYIYTSTSVLASLPPQTRVTQENLEYFL